MLGRTQHVAPQPSVACASWCIDNKQPWSLKCARFKSCGGCAQCSLLPGVASNSHASLLVQRNSGAASLLDNCWHVYVDVGSNIGVQTRKLFEPSKYWTRDENSSLQETHRIFTRYFGEQATRRAHCCAVGFEPNPHHHQRLKLIEETYTSLGWRTNFLPLAASVRSGTSIFHYDTSKTGRSHHEWGASLVATDYNQKSGLNSNGDKSHQAGHFGRRTKVGVVDLAQWLGSQVLARRLPTLPSKPSLGTPSLVMKVDVEGAELDVLPRLVHTRVLCHFAHVMVEFHPGAYPTHVNPMQFIQVFLANASAACPETVVSTLDDETYNKDGVPLPSRANAHAIHGGGR